MREKKRLRLFLFDAVDYPAAEAWLNDQAEQGWELKRIWPGPLAVFRPAERRDLRYAVTLDPSRGDGAREDAYLQSMEDAGWRKAACKYGMFIFTPAPGAATAPLHTDLEREHRERYRHARRDLSITLIALAVLAAVILLLVLLRGIDKGPFLFYDWALKDERIVAILTVLPAAASLVCETAALLRLRRAVREDRRELAALGGVRARKLLPMLVPVLLLAAAVMGVAQGIRQEHVSGLDGEALVTQATESAPVLRGGDLGLNGSPIYLSSEPGLLVDRVSYMETGLESLISDRFECRGEALACWFAGDMVRAGVEPEIIGYSRMDGPILEPADLGFDQSWICSGEGWSQIILREGNVVAVVHGPLDLTDPALPDILRERLRLE